MKLLLEDRVEQAFRHLQPKEVEKVERVFYALQTEPFENIRKRFQIHKLLIPEEQVFVLRATPQLRILFKYGEEQTLIIEDIVSHKMLEKFYSGRHK